MKLKSLIIASLIATAPVVASAQSIDSWYDQKTRYGRQSISGETRTYHTAGSASYRISPQSNYLMSIQPPRIQSGCGGIDIFMGSASFLNRNFLVERFEGMLQAAPYVMMDIAVNALNQQLGGAVSRAQSIIDRLNQLQFDECSSSKVMVTQVMGMSGALGDRREEIEGDAIREWGVRSGTAGFMHGITRDWGALRDEFTTTTHQDLLAGCTDIFKDVFQPGSMIDNVLYAFYGASVAVYADIIRGLVGDVRILDIHSGGVPTGNLQARAILPCQPADSADLRTIAFGNIQIQEFPEYECKLPADSRSRIHEYVGSLLSDLTASLRSYNNHSLTADQQAMLQVITIPVIETVRTAIEEELEDDVIRRLAELISLNLAYQMIYNFHTIATAAINEAEDVLKAERGAKPGELTFTCRYDIFDEGFSSLLELRDNSKSMITHLAAQYSEIEHTTVEAVDRLYRLSEIRRENAETGSLPVSTRNEE
ncbi:TraH family protein [Desulfurispirillum indicum S5]|uniref:TraH family protein n=1 Tax=Desulfurispirillum indicum (strain ATCC BAA-1389 / DSM 22839 / S5) TaxID=653733 RepID=E6W6X0_DESIS|nr:conjugal transfer protein TraH [Desulfurispirillum indicum]ADU66213.1 TraH family protein [Desulfurispirillum indicum S5]